MSENTASESMGKKILFKIISVVGMIALTGALIFGGYLLMINMDGIMRPLTERKIERYVDESMTDFLNSPDDTVTASSVKKVKTGVLDDEQIKLMKESISGVTYEIKVIELADDGQSAKVKVVLHNVKDTDLDDLAVGKYKDLKSQLKKAGSGKRTFKLSLIKEDGEWTFKDLNPLYSAIVLPYGKFCFLDDNGEPLEKNEEYFKWFIRNNVEPVFVDAYWYDPVLGNPLTDDYLSSPSALTAAFYFSEPVDMTFTAELVKDDASIASKEISTGGRVLTTVTFEEDEAGGSLRSGYYRIILKVEDAEAAKTSRITVR